MRANVYYDTLDEPPTPGSLQEAVCGLVYKARAQQTFAKTLMIVSDRGSQMFEDAYDEYRNALFPYIRYTKVNRDKRIREILEKAFQDGPLTVRKPPKGWEKLDASNRLPTDVPIRRG